MLMGQLKTYFDFAEDDFKYFMASCDAGFVANAMGALAQGICEKYLKHIIENYVKPDSYEANNERDSILRTHSLMKLQRYLGVNLPDFTIDRTKLRMVDGFYFTTRYPGEESIEITREDIEDCKLAIEECREKALRYIQSKRAQPARASGTETEPELPRRPAHKPKTR